MRGCFPVAAFLTPPSGIERSGRYRPTPPNFAAPRGRGTALLPLGSRGARTPLAFHTATDMVLGFGTGVPFGLNARQQQAWWTHGGGARLVNDALKALGTYGVPAGTTGPQMGGWFKKEIRKFDRANHDHYDAYVQYIFYYAAFYPSV